ncbi:MAG TPA: GNAT family N-acetyltransferase [Candidatus Limnocylindrales bacterium]|nr:GNAT family N-acetyltransferase [Candidatus Limnocylindrales bacterium]
MADAEKLRREGAGRYVSADGRFTVEQSSGRWLAIDAETTDDLGLPLVRGPFATLDDARAAIGEARSGPPPSSDLPKRAAPGPRSGRRPAGTRGHPGAQAATKTPTRPREPAIELRDFAAADADALRAIWKTAGFRATGDDDRSLAAFVERNPGLFVVATADDVVIGSALGAWDGRRGWIYHVAVVDAFRRRGIATRLVKRVEQRLRVMGAPRINAIVRDANDPAKGFWSRLGYEAGESRLYGRDV